MFYDLWGQAISHPDSSIGSLSVLCATARASCPEAMAHVTWGLRYEGQISPALSPVQAGIEGQLTEAGQLPAT